MPITIELNNVPTELDVGEEITCDYRIHIDSSSSISAGENQRICVYAYDVTDSTEGIPIKRVSNYFGAFGAGNYYYPHSGWLTADIGPMPNHDISIQLRLIRYNLIEVDGEYQIDWSSVEVLGASDTFTVQLPPPPPPPAIGNIHVETNPDNCGIWLDGEYKGTSPITLYDVPSGDHVVTAKKHGYYPRSETITVNTGETTNVLLELEEIPPSNLHIFSDPSGAEAYLDGSYVGITPVYLDGIAPGSMLVVVRKEGYYDWSQHINLEPGHTLEITAELERIPEPFGNLTINSNPPEANIFLDGEDTGFTTPHTFEHIPSGNHHVKLTKNGYYDYETDVYLSPEEDKTINVDLDPIPIGNLVVESDPPGARIYLNDEDTGFTTPHTFEGISAGTYNITLKKTCYYDYTDTVTVNIGETTNFYATLTHGSGRVYIGSNPYGARIFLDGEDTGYVTNRWFNLPCKRYTLRLVKENFHEYTSAFIPDLYHSTYIVPTLTRCYQRIIIHSNPPGARIYINGEDTGLTTPYGIGKPVGEYNIRLVLDGYHDYETTVRLECDTDTTIEAELEPIEIEPTTATINVNSDPPGADVYLDDTYLGTTPGSFEITLDGTTTYTITISKEYYDSYTQDITVSPGDVININATLTELPETITIITNPIDVSVYLDDEYKGNTTETGLIIDNVTVGEHAVRLEKEGYETITTTINVEHGTDNIFEFNLTEIPPAPREYSFIGNLPWILLLLILLLRRKKKE